MGFGSIKEGCLAILAIAGCALFVSSEIIFGDQVITWDLYDYSLPYILYLKDALFSGTFPLWNPFILAGEALFSQPAAFVYNPFYFIVIGLSSFWSTYYSLQLTMVLLSILGGAGVYGFLIRWPLSRSVATFGGAVYACTAFGPILGQPPLVVSIALFPWVLVLSRRLIEEGRRWQPLSVFAGSLFLGFLLLSSYFATSLYILLFVFLYVLFEIFVQRKSFDNSDRRVVLLKFVTVGAFGLLLAAVYLMPAIYNRIFFYADLAGDFISPEPRMRGLLVTRDQIVDIISSPRVLASVLFDLKVLAPDRATWTIGIGQFFAFLGLWGLAYYKQKPRLRFFSIATLVLIFYVLGPGSLVFEFVYYVVPILKNIRYPVFAFFLLQFCLIVLGAVVLDSLLSKDSQVAISFRKSRMVFAVLFVLSLLLSVLKSSEFVTVSIVLGLLTAISWNQGKIFYRFDWARNAFVFLLFCELLFFVHSTGIYRGRALNIIESASIKPNNFSLENRVQEVHQVGGDRLFDERNLYDFSSKAWITEKKPFNHGYSTSDSPLYWYLKSHNFLRRIFHSPTKVLKTSLPERTEFTSDAAYLEALATAIPRRVSDGVFVSDTDGGPVATTGSPLEECDISDIRISPNSFQVTATSKGGCLLFLSNKFFPGWKVAVDGAEAQLLNINRLFMGSFVPGGEREVRFYFSPPIFWYGLTISVSALLLLIGITLRGCVLARRVA